MRLAITLTAPGYRNYVLFRYDNSEGSFCFGFMQEAIQNSNNFFIVREEHQGPGIQNCT